MTRWRRNTLLGAFVASALAQPAHAWSLIGLPMPSDLCRDQCAQPGEVEYLPLAELFPPTPELIVTPDLTEPRPDFSSPEGFSQARDTELQQQLEQLVAAPALARAIREKRFAAALVDITDAERPRLATVNGDVMLYAASLPKIAILLGVFEKAHQQNEQLDAATLDSATRMIRSSSNSAATEMYFAVGPAQLARYLQSDRYRLYDREFGGGLWVGKPYARRDTWKRDPIANLSHGATAFQVARFLYLLETGQLVSPEASEQMKEIMSKPAIRHKFVKGLGDARPGSEIFRKSGTWRTYHSDAGIIERDGRRYIAVMLANDPAGSAWLSELIVKFDNLIHS